MSVKTKNEWNRELAFINGRFIEVEKYIRHTLQIYEQGTAQNVQLIGFLQVMRATCQRRCVKNTDSYKPSNTNVFEANYFIFIVWQKKEMLRTHISILYSDLYLLSIANPNLQ